MALVPVGPLLKKAREGRYAVGAFNCNNLEILQAIIAAAEAERSPVIIQASQGGLKYAGLEYITAMVQAAAAKAAVRAGFTAVMVDGSQLPFAENVELVRRVADVAHCVGVSVEGELGRIGGKEDDIVVAAADAFLTDPDEACRFVQETGVDALAVAIGTAHGVYKGEPRLDFARLDEINRQVDVPLVLHGASGLSDEAIRQAIELGITKINIDTEIRQAFAQGVREVLEEDPEEIDPRRILGPARERMQEVVQRKMRLFGCSRRA